MALYGIIERGIRTIIEDGRGSLEALVASRALQPEVVPHIEQCLEAVPGLLNGLQQAVSDPSAPGHARDLYVLVLGYLFLEDDLIPSHGGRPVLGVLDDVYLLHRAAAELAPHVGRIDTRSIDGGMALLKQVLLPGVVRQLDAKIASATAKTAKV